MKNLITKIALPLSSIIPHSIFRVMQLTTVKLDKMLKIYPQIFSNTLEEKSTMILFSY